MKPFHQVEAADIAYFENVMPGRVFPEAPFQLITTMMK